MGTSRELTENQIKDAKQAVALRATALEKKGVAKEAYKRDAIWRKLDGKVRQISARLRKIGEVEALNAEVIRLREEKLAAANAEAPAETEKPKKKKAPAAEKAKDQPEAKEGGKGKDKEKAPKKKAAKE